MQHREVPFVGYPNARNERSVLSALAACYRDAVAAISDTSPKVEALHLELYRAAGTARRARIAAELSDAVRETALAGIRRRHPEFSEAQVRSAFLNLLYRNGSRF